MRARRGQAHDLADDVAEAEHRSSLKWGALESGSLCVSTLS